MIFPNDTGAYAFGRRSDEWNPTPISELTIRPKTLHGPGAGGRCGGAHRCLDLDTTTDDDERGA